MVDFFPHFHKLNPRRKGASDQTMSELNFDSVPEGDWEECGEVEWNERDYRQFLKHHEGEVARFISTYEKLEGRPDRLDKTAWQMGWRAGDWNWIGSYNSFTDERDAFEDEAGAPLAPTEFEADMVEPYPLHKYPVFIVTRGIYQSLRQCWKNYMAIQSSDTATGLTPEMAWQFAEKLHEGEINSTLALQSLELGELDMVICLFKNSLAALNKSLDFVQNLPRAPYLANEIFMKQARIRLFDLREMWLREIKACRTAIQLRNQDSD